LSKSPHEGRKKGKRIAVHKWIATMAARITTSREATEIVLATKRMFPLSSHNSFLGCYYCLSGTCNKPCKTPPPQWPNKK